MIELATRNSKYQIDLRNKRYRTSSLAHNPPLWCEWHPYTKLGIAPAGFVGQGRRLFIYLPDRDNDPIVTSRVTESPETVKFPAFSVIA